MVIEFLLKNWISVVVVAVLLVYTGYLAITNQWEKIRQLAYKLMLLAERSFRNQDGEVKFDFVVRIVYRSIPSWMRIFIKEEDICGLIQKWYDLAKDFLDDGEINQSTLVESK